VVCNEEDIDDEPRATTEEEHTQIITHTERHG